MAEDIPVSSEVSAGGDALASQYNNLRTDLFGHTHDGIGGSLDWDTCWADAVHTHGSNAEGGQLDWDTCWADAFHSHGSDAEGGQLDWDTCWLDAVHIHSSAGEGGALYNRRAFPWGIKGKLVVADAQGMRFICPKAMTGVKLYAYTTSGSGVAIRIDKNGASYKTLSSIGTAVVSSAVVTAIAENDKLTLDITTSGTGVDLWVILECRHLISTS